MLNPFLKYQRKPVLSKLSKIYASRITYFKRNLTKDTRSNKIFIKDDYGELSFTQIDKLSKRLSNDILKTLDKSDLNGERIGVYCHNNYTYLMSLLAIWHSNGVPICLSKLYPTNYLDYFMNDSKCKLIINGTGPSNNNNSTEFDKFLNKSVYNFVLNEQTYLEDKDNLKFESNPIDLSTFAKNKEAIQLYTSGTSGPPKGVVLTFDNLVSSIQIMRDSWGWTADDCMLSTLPLNHYSGLVYTLLTPFHIGAQVDLMSKFNVELAWSKLLNEENPINVFIGVPTIFGQLIDYYLKNKDLIEKNHVKDILKRKMRFIGSGSAPLNVKTYNDWFSLTNYKILERYGMTEIGMVLTNPYVETDSAQRIAGTVGRPCGNIKVRLVDEIESRVQVLSDSEEDLFYNESLVDKKEAFGELQVSGPVVFKEYFNKKDHTEKSFTKDGWFKTGDTAQFLPETNIYKIIGRTNVDVIKSGGYKISALDIEKEILAHPEIADVAVMGMSDSVWGQRVFSLIVLKHNENNFDEKKFKTWCTKRLPKYSVPTVIKFIDKLPRNMMGKVNKKELIKDYEAKK